MLIAEKIQEISDKHAEILAKFDNLESSVKAQYSKNFDKALKDLQKSLETTLQESTNNATNEANENLKAENAKELKNLISNTKTELESLKSSIAETSKALAQETTSNFLERFQSEVIAPLSEALSPKVNEALESSIKNSQDSLTSEAVKKYLDSIDLGHLLDYSQIALDSNTITDALKNDSTFKTEVNNALETHTKSFLETSEGKVLIRDEVKKNAINCFKSAIAEDELIKMRYECALRLQSLNILGTQELISRISVAIKKPQDSAQAIRNNTLVSQ